jgi:DNA-binding response OmpR family regulator
VSTVLLLTTAPEPASEILPALSLLGHAVRLAPPGAEVLRALSSPPAGLAAATVPDVVLVDARRDLVRSKDLIQQVSAVGVPVIAIIGEGGWAAVSAEWGADDVLLPTAGPGEVEARLRLASGRAAVQLAAPQAEELRSGELVIDEATYSARIRGVALDLTFKEFELLKFLAQHPRRVFTRSQLLQEVWGYDYFGGTRTVDVHVRRLRAKLGAENEALIGTVRNVGYKFVPAKHEDRLTDRSTSQDGASQDMGSQHGGSQHGDGAGNTADARRADRDRTAQRRRSAASRGNGASR